MNDHLRVPERLRHALERELGAVRPLYPPGLRVLGVFGSVVVLLAVVSLFGGVRGDLGVLGPWAGWGTTLAELMAGSLLIWLALREAIPGRSLPVLLEAAALVLATSVQVTAAILAWSVQPVLPPVGSGNVCAVCFSLEALMGLPALVLTLWLVARAYPVRPVWAGVLGGAGAGMVADGLQHLVCPISDLRHVLVWHGGAILGLAAVGGLAGAVLRWWRRRNQGG